ncbi:hypothetical protein AXK58_13680 [Tsukamurella tyrosinosolvens]|nr:hypothetical protein AXK58_13680 [Tsukamurella tyrosinosolvens]
MRAGEWGISAEFLDTDTGAWEVVSHTEVVAILSSGDTAGLDAELIALVREAAEALRQGKETA